MIPIFRALPSAKLTLTRTAVSLIYSKIHRNLVDHYSCEEHVSKLLRKLHRKIVRNYIWKIWDYSPDDNARLGWNIPIPCTRNLTFLTYSIFHPVAFSHPDIDKKCIIKVVSLTAKVKSILSLLRLFQKSVPFLANLFFSTSIFTKFLFNFLNQALQTTVHSCFVYTMVIIIINVMWPWLRVFDFLFFIF